MVNNEQRRRQLAREKFERQRERREAARRKARRRNVIIASGLAVVLAAGVAAYASTSLTDDSGDSAASSDPNNSDKATGSPSAAADPCTAKPAPGSPATATWKKEPDMSIDTSAAYTMKLDTTCGSIGLKLDAKNAPHTVNSFKFLADKGFFDHTKCHRLTTSNIYVLQCGDPKGTGSGGPGYTLPDENLKSPSLKGNVYPAGTVAMANTGKAHTGGSQFFLVYQDSQLPPQYTPFGTIDADGMKVLKKIAAAGESSGQGDGAPNASVVINKAAVTSS
ncbi:peptidylprolyl isomerase [Streptomyces sp. NPDC057654]|uniref:peptidylprolyl isomerase n=1 Tax=Streptomyces sp. NPDC057654 TaxID=3346196 RepID=UPI0036B28A93